MINWWRWLWRRLDHCVHTMAEVFKTLKKYFTGYWSSLRHKPFPAERGNAFCSERNSASAPQNKGLARTTAEAHSRPAGQQPAPLGRSRPQVGSPVPVCVLRWAFRWELFVYTLLHPSKSHLWIRRFLESGDSDRLWRLVLSILNGEIELEKEKVELSGEKYSMLLWF